MKILFVNDYAAPVGGVEIITLRLMDRMRERGHDARLFASSAQPLEGSRAADFECFGTTSRFRTLLQTLNPWAFWRLRQTLGEFAPDVVHVNMFLTQLSPLILPLLRKIPSLYQVHWYRPVCPLGTKTLPDRTACRVSAGVACYRNRCLPLRDWLPIMLQMTLWRHWRSVFKVIVANGECIRQSLAVEGFSPIEVIYYGLPDQSARASLSPLPTVAFAGRLVKQKGVDVLLRAFAQVVARIPEAQLLLVGDGPEHDGLVKLSEDLNLTSQVSFVGRLSLEETGRACAGCWVQAVPSLYAESFGLVAVEGMLRGAAVVASDSDGLTGIIQHGQTGLLVPPGDPHALAEALISLLQNRVLTEQMGKAGRAVALARWSEEAYVDRIVRLYQDLCLNHNTEPA